MKDQSHPLHDIVPLQPHHCVEERKQNDFPVLVAENLPEGDIVFYINKLHGFPFNAKIREKGGFGHFGSVRLIFPR
jgi:hypothetical protein